MRSLDKKHLRHPSPRRLIEMQNLRSAYTDLLSQNVHMNKKFKDLYAHWSQSTTGQLLSLPLIINHNPSKAPFQFLLLYSPSFWLTPSWTSILTNFHQDLQSNECTHLGCHPSHVPSSLVTTFKSHWPPYQQSLALDPQPSHPSPSLRRSLGHSSPTPPSQTCRGIWPHTATLSGLIWNSW